MKKILILILCVITSPIISAQVLEVDNASAIDDLIENGVFTDIEFNEISNDVFLVYNMGKPDSIYEEPISNPYPNTEASAVTYLYPGLKISYYHHKQPPPSWKSLGSIEVSSDKYELKHGIAIGMRWDDITRRFGPAHFRSRHQGLYYLGYAHRSDGFPHAMIKFGMRIDTLAVVRWSNWP